MEPEKAINKMMEMCGYNARYHHIKQMDALNYPWFSEYSCTSKEAQAFKEWFVNEEVQENKKRYGVKWAKHVANQAFNAFWFYVGLREID